MEYASVYCNYSPVYQCCWQHLAVPLVAYILMCLSSRRGNIPYKDESKTSVWNFLPTTPRKKNATAQNMDVTDEKTISSPISVCDWWWSSRWPFHLPYPHTPCDGYNLPQWVVPVITTISFCRCTANVHQHVSASPVHPQYCHQVNPWSLYKCHPHFSHIFLGPRSCGMPFLFGLTIPQQLILPSDHHISHNKFPMYISAHTSTFVVSSVPMALKTILPFNQTMSCQMYTRVVKF